MTWLARLLMAGGAATLAWCAFVMTDACIVHQTAHRRLESMRHAASSASARVETLPSPEPEGQPEPLPPRAMEAPSLLAAIVRPMARPSDALGELSIPRLQFSAVVFEGTNNRTLRFGLGHVKDTPLPGEAGNVAIAGHRDSFFRRLRELREGDDVWVDTIDRRVRYHVTWLRVVDPREVSVLDPTSEPALTLVTCFPFQFVGPAPYRFVVRATREVTTHEPEQ